MVYTGGVGRAKAVSIPAPPAHRPLVYPLCEKIVELDVPAMVHVSASCNPAFHFAARS
jgi:hypothetical protein